MLRIQYGRRGLAIPATKGAKLKTLVQALAVGTALWPGGAQDLKEWLAPLLLGVAVVLTLGTGWQYFRAGSRLSTARSAGVRHGVTPPRRKARSA